MYLWAYRKIILPDSLSEADSINTADAFLINKCDEFLDNENNYLISSLMDDYIKEFTKSIWMISQVVEN